MDWKAVMERPTGAELRIRRQANITSELRCRFEFANLGEPGRFELPGKKSREVRKVLKTMRSLRSLRLISSASFRPLEKTFGRQQAGSLLGKFFQV